MGEPHYQDQTVTIYHGDCLDVLRELPDASVDAVVTDPPYDLTNRTPDVLGCEACGRTLGGRDGTPAACPRCGGELTRQRSAQGRGFMGKAWDGTGIAFRPAVWIECLRVLKPGGHMLAFGGTRTSHRLACAVEDAGFEIRDSIAWLYGSGFPKSLDVSKAIDKAAGAERDIRRWRSTDSETFGQAAGFVGRVCLSCGRHAGSAAANCQCEDAAPATPDAERWQGWGTALKPAHEPIVVARKPLAGTVAANVQAHGTGALNVDGCRVGTEDVRPKDAIQRPHDEFGTFIEKGGRARSTGGGSNHTAGRWPANVVLDEGQAAALDAQSGDVAGAVSNGHKGKQGLYEDGLRPLEQHPGYGDTGGASRFFYTAKAASSERVKLDGTAHPTVKPLALMRWLVRLVTPPGGTVLEPFAGSGTTVEACILEGFACIAIEREADYLPLITQRIHRRRDPVQAIRATTEDAGLFDLINTEEDPTQ